MNIKPSGKLKVRKPGGEHLSEKGEDLEITPFWMRRLKDGDVEEVKKEFVPKQKISKKKAMTKSNYLDEGEIK